MFVYTAQIHCGIGPAVIETFFFFFFFAIFNVPGITTRALKRKEREAGKCIEDIAGDSCLKAVELEKSMTERFIFKTHV